MTPDPLAITNATDAILKHIASLMNQINPNKLLLSKWTAVAPKQKERHFMVGKLIRDKDGVIVACELEAVINHAIYEIDWRTLKDSSCWQMGWL